MGPSIAVPAVTITAPSRPRVRTARPAAPARVTTLPPPATTPTPTAAPGASTTGQPAATSPFNQPAASLTTITSSQIQASPAQSFGNLFFTLPGATSAGLAPGASRPVLRGLDDFRVRVQENGIGSMDVSDLGQDHGVPIDPLSI
ncbi:MAG TPA: Plug domain-containing protein, partial [Vicinamibacterales bacterium]|nr:Plug domain-containing protein [Vicinamibacterales bacterium]